MSIVPQQSPEPVPEPPAELLAALAPELPPELPGDLPPPLPVEAAADRGVGQVYLLLAISACLMLVVWALVHRWSPYLALAAVEIVLLVVAVVYVQSKQVPLAAALRWRPISPVSALLSVGLGASAFAVGTVIALLTIPMLGPVPQIEILNTSTPQQLGILLLCGAVLPGICEETLFRGVIQSVLARRGAIKSVLITSLLFALFHFNPWNFLPPLFYGVVFGIVTTRTRSTIPAMIAHTSTNAVVLTVGYLSHGQGHLWLLIIVATLVVVFAVGFPIYLIKTRHQVFRPGLLASVPAALSKRERVAATVLAVVFAGLILLATLGLWTKYRDSSEHRFGHVRRGDRVTQPPTIAFQYIVNCNGRHTLARLKSNGRAVPI